MQPRTPRDFLKVADQRLHAARRILQLTGLNLEAQYIGGYSVECSLKALILENTPPGDLPEMFKKLTRGQSSHRFEILLGYLRDQGIRLDVRLARRLGRFGWDTSLRYEIGRRDTGETKGLLRTAETIYHWAQGQIS